MAYVRVCIPPTLSIDFLVLLFVACCISTFELFTPASSIWSVSFANHDPHCRLLINTKLSHLLLCSLLGLTHAVPTPTQPQNDATELERRGPISDALNGLADVLSDAANDGFELGNNILTKLDNIGPTTSPTSPAQAMSQIQGIIAPSASPTPNIFAAVGQLVANGLTTDDAQSARSGGSASGENSFNNVNTRNPAFTVFPKCIGFLDAPYTQSEATLRAAIHIPSSFRYGAAGAPPPIILVPGTGSTGYLTFSGNYITLLQGSDIADPVWLNIPE